MRATLLDWLPADLSGKRVLDAGCGTGALAVEAARRGAEVLGIDLSPTLVALAQDRLPHDLSTGSVRLMAGDMLDPALGQFDHVVAMDSLIHYELPEVVRALTSLAPRLTWRIRRLSCEKFPCVVDGLSRWLCRSDAFKDNRHQSEQVSTVTRPVMLRPKPDVSLFIFLFVIPTDGFKTAMLGASFLVNPH